MLAQEMIVQEETKIEAFVKALGDSIPHRVSGPQKAHLMTVLQEWKRRSGGIRKELIRCLRCSELGTLEERYADSVYNSVHRHLCVRCWKLVHACIQGVQVMGHWHCSCSFVLAST